MCIRDRTEGWACALQLAAIALEQQLTNLPRQTGSSFADALLDDLFSRQPADLQQFLRDTSILSRLSPSLCDAVTESTDAVSYTHLDVYKRQVNNVSDLDFFTLGHSSGHAERGGHSQGDMV